MPTPPKPRKNAPGRSSNQRSRHKMGPLEAQYAPYLDGRKARGEIKDWQFQPVKLRICEAVEAIGDAKAIREAWYTPDFRIIENDDAWSFHELKGFLDLSGDGWLKFKLAVSLHPHTFYMVQRVKGEWKIERYGR